MFPVWVLAEWTWQRSPPLSQRLELGQLGTRFLARVQLGTWREMKRPTRRRALLCRAGVRGALPPLVAVLAVHRP